MHLLTFPPEKSFVDILAAYVQRNAGIGALVLLPTRRACVALREACLRHNAGAPLLLPRIAPLGDVEDEIGIGAWIHTETAQSLPPAIAPLKREAILARLSAEHFSLDMEHAARMARALTQLFDAALREELPLSKLDALVPEALAEHWQITLRMLHALHGKWQAYLAQAGLMEPIARRNRMLRALAEQWQASPPTHSIIAAGSTGSLPATAHLLKTIAELPRGSVILPGLDTASSHDVWEHIAESHAQFGLKQLLGRLNVTREDVRLWDDATLAPSCPPQRMQMLRAALRPAESGKPQDAIDTATATQAMHVLNAATPQEEARVIALLLREVLETPGKRAAIITHDRQLARRIAMELQQHAIDIDDTAGRPVLSSEQGTFLRLVADTALAHAAPVPLLSLLKHRLTACGMEPAQCRAAAREWEVLALRGVRPTFNIGAMRAQLEGSAAALALLESFTAAMQEFMHALRGGHAPFATLLELHLQAAEAISSAPTETGAQRIWTGTEGQALAAAIAELRAAAESMGRVEAQQYPALFNLMLSRATYHQAYGQHPRLHILSPMEARLQRYDRVILAGLNEECWPPAPEISPWMSRPMQRSFGLALPERAIGMSAHDFYMLSAASEIIYTRAARIEGATATPSRFLQRLDALLHALQGAPWQWPPLAHARWAEMLRMPYAIPPIAPPAPAPPLSARPRSVNVTDIERWQQDPYALYARYILRLRPLKALDQQPSARELGNVLHDAMHRFSLLWPDISKQTLLECGRQAFAVYSTRPAVRAFWQPRFAAIAQWITQQESARLPLLKRIQPECTGEWTWQAPAGAFTLSTRIDRLEWRKDGGIALVDYKTGTLPPLSALQLPLEAHIITALHKPREVAELAYWRLAGTQNEEKSIPPESIPARIAEAAAELMALVARFDDPATPYAAPADTTQHDYAHLERADEWRGMV